MLEEKTFIELKNKNRLSIPEKFQNFDDRYSEEFVEYFINKYTKENDIIFDPFSGLGTSIFIAEEMNRIPYGLEKINERVEYIKSKLKNKNKNNIINGNSLELSKYNLPNFDFCISSPPYTKKFDSVDPLNSFKESKNYYKEYLKNIFNVYSQIKNVMKKESYVIVESSNIKGKNEGEETTTLAWDVAKEISKIFFFEGEIIICFKDEFGYGYNHSYALVFKNK